MPRTPLHALAWSSDHRCYELYTRGQRDPQRPPADDAVLLAWLGEITSFAFHSPAGSLNVYQEARPRGGSYWYAYHTSQGRTRKRYLGQTAQVKLNRLEAMAQALASASPPPTPAPTADASSDSVAPHAAKQPLVLSNKLTPPRLPHALVERPRLLAALDGALLTPLTLLSASAGCGKTTLLATWARQHPEYVAWLSLDELDNSPTRFWVGFIAALRRTGSAAPDLGEATLALLQSPQPPPLSTCLSVLLQDLEPQGSQTVHLAPIIVVLDDYQVISDPAIHESVTFLLEHLPAHVHVVLASRVDPDLPLARLRVREQLTELRAAELHFRLTEASALLRQAVGSTLAEAEVAAIQQRTEGWAAGLHLAALSLRQQDDRSAWIAAWTGSQRYLLDYVQEDILARLPADVRTFLLHTAILSRLDAAVCQAVTEAPTLAACQHMLSYLERHNLFLVPLGEERRWYRLHDLFREALLAALHTTQPEVAPRLHRRAASYYEAQGEWAEAIAHRLAALDFDSAARLMERTAEQFWLRGEAATLARWVLALPQQVVRKHARLVLTVALYLLNTVTYATGEQRARTHAEVRQLMARVETALEPRILPAEGDESSERKSALHATAGAAVAGLTNPVEDQETHDTNADEDQEAHDTNAAEKALLHWRLRALRMALVFLEAAARGEHERLSRMQPEIEAIQGALDHDEDAIWQIMPLSSAFVLYFTVRQEGALMVPRLLETQRRVSRLGSHFATIKLMQYLAIAAADAGQLRLAYEESVAALHLIEQVEGYAVLKGYFEMVQVEVLYQWNQLEEARSRLHAVLHDATMRQQLDVLGGSYFALMRVELARGDRSAAEEALRGLEDLVRREGFGTYPRLLPSIHALWCLSQGLVADAAAWAAGIVFHEGAWENGMYFEFRTVIRTYFAQQRWSEALALLERWSGHLDRPGNVGITIMFLTHLLVALHQTGRRAQTRRVAERLFALTEAEGYLRMYLDEGEPMRQTLRAFLTPRSPLEQREQHNQPAPPTISTTYVSRLLAAFEREQHDTSTALEAASSLSLVPTLTRREQEVLRLLAQGASNQEIAQTLVITLATVKKHVSNVLGKLDATSRTQAIVQARARSLL